MIEVRPYQHTDLEELRTIQLRQSDQDEALAYLGQEPNEALCAGAAMSSFCEIVRIDRKVVAIYGLVSLGGYGSPWFVGTDDLYSHRATWARMSKQALQKMLNITTYLMNFTSSKHAEAIRWLEWLGFTVDKSREFVFYDPNVPFYMFYWR